jgi:hypothetical protein
MAQRLFPPFHQFLDDTPEALEGYRVFFYEAGTTDKLDTYRDSTLDTENDNPMTLNSAGRLPYAVFGQNRDYKVVIALPAADDPNDPPTSIVLSADPVRSNDLTTFMELKVGSGAPTGVVSGTAGSAGVLPTGYWDYTNSIEYRCTTTGDEASALWTALNASAASPSVPTPQGRLTLTSGMPLIASDVLSATALYYTPDSGNLAPIYNGATFTPTEFSELTLTLASQHALSTIYDVFIFSNAGVLTLVTGPAWSVSTAGSGARGTGASTTQLARVKGLYTNAVAMSGRNGATTYSVGANLATYLGSIFIDGSAGQVTDHVSWGQNRKRGVWNAFNKRNLILQGGTSGSWTYNTNAIRASNNDSANKLTVFCGLPDEQVQASFLQLISSTSGNDQRPLSGMGWNSTTTLIGTGAEARSGEGNPQVVTVRSEYDAAPFIGINNIQAIENGAVGGGTFYGTQAKMLLKAVWRG